MIESSHQDEVQEPNPLRVGACMSNDRSAGELPYFILLPIPIRALVLHP